MNTKGIKFLAVLAVLAMAFAACAVMVNIQQGDAVTGDASSPLDDGAVPAPEAAIKVGKMTFTPYIQLNTTIKETGTNSYKIYGEFTGTKTVTTNQWHNVYTGFAKTLSFSIALPTAGDEANHYYVYQVNPGLPEESHDKVSPLNSSAGADGKVGGANPSFEIAVPSGANKTVSLKIVVASEALSDSQVKEATATKANVVDVATYTLVFDGGQTEITDSNAVSLGFYAKLTVATGTPTVKYFTTLDQALNSIQSKPTADVTITVLADHTGLTFGKVKDTSNTEYKLTIDLNGKTYQASAKTATADSGKNAKSIYFYKGSAKEVEFKDGTVKANSANDGVSVLMKSFAPKLTLTNVTFDGSDLKVTSTNAQFDLSYGTSTHTYRGATLYLANGTVNMDDKTQIIGSSTAPAMVVYGYEAPTVGAYSGVIVNVNGAAVSGDVIVTTEADKNKSTSQPATLNVYSGSINGTLMTPTSQIYNGADNKFTAAAKTINLNGMTVKTGETLTIAANTAVTIPSPDSTANPAVTGVLTNNGTIVNKGTMAGTGSVVGTGVIDNKGILNVYGYIAELKTWHQIYCSVNLYGTSTWKAVQDGTAGIYNIVYSAPGESPALFNYASEDKLKGTFKQVNKSDGTIDSATFDVKGAVTVNDGTWMTGSESHIVNVKNGGSIAMKAGEDLTIYAKDVVSFEAGALFTSADEIIVKAQGVLNYADTSQYYDGIVIEEGGKVNITGEGGSSEKEVEVIPDAKIEAAGKKVDANTFDTGFDVIVTTCDDITSVVVPTGKAVIMNAKPATNAEMDISADNTELTINTGNTAATYTVNAGGDNKIYLEGVKGSLTFTKGSIEIDISKWTGGEIKLDDDAVVKIFGTTTVNNTDLKISMKNAGKTASLSIVEDKVVDITFTGTYTDGFSIGAGIDFTIDGKLKATKLTTNDNVTVGAKGTLEATTFAAGGTAKTVSVHGKLVTTTVSGAAKFVAYGTSDINDANLSYDKVTGKDSNGGTWVFESASKLVFKNYSGNYNFEKFKTAITNIVVEGTNKVAYAKEIAGTPTPTEFVLFGNYATPAAMKIETIQGTGSLEVVLNLSKTKGANLNLTNGIFVFDSAAFTQNTADLKITVSGSKSDWKADEIRAMKVTAIKASTVTIEDSSLIIDVMSSYSIIDPADGSIDGTVYGIKAAGNVKITNTDLSEISVKTAGEAINAVGEYDVTVSGSAFVLDAKTTALTADDIEFSNSAITISGKNAIITSAAGAESVSFTGAILSEIKGTDYALASSTAGAAVNAEVKIRSSAILFEGAANVTALTITSGSIIAAEDLTTAGKLDISQASELKAKDLRLKSSIDSVNNGTITISGYGVIEYGAKLTNNAVLVNEGVFGVVGELANVTPGIFTNDGKFITTNKKINENGSFSIGGDVRTADTKAKVKSITITESAIEGDGSASVKATISFDKIAEFTVKGYNEFVGTISPSQVTDDGSYTLTLSNGTATVTISYVKDSSKTGTIGDNYTITVSGVLVDNVDPTKVLYLEPNKSDKTITPTDSLKTMFNVSGAKLTLTSGKMVNSDSAIIYSSLAGFIGTNATYEGALTTKIAEVSIAGVFTGDLTAEGTTGVTVSNNFTGDIVSKGPVSLTGATKTMKGDITAVGDVTIAGTLDGSVEIDLKAGASAKLTVSGKMTGDLDYVSAYKLKNDDKIDTEYTNTINVDANMFQTDKSTKSFEISLVAGVNATTSKDGEPGYFAFGTLAAPEAGKNVKLTLTEGMIKLASKVTLPERFSIVIEKDSTLEIVKGATFDVKNAALKVNKDAIKHFETGTVATTYGLVEYVMSFAIEDGAYSIYSDVAYALTNCDEGAELTVGSSAKITDNISVKKGVNVIVSDKVTLEFQTFGLEMADDAKITLMGTGKVTFGQTGEDKTDDTAWEFFTISGTFVFDEGKNKIVFDDVRFDAAGAELSGKAATASADSAFSVKLNYSEGEATLAMGNATGSVVLKNTKYPLAKGADDSLFSGSFVIAADTVYEGTITDMAGDATYAESIYTVTMKPTYVTVNGTFKATSGITVNGVYGGAGKVVLSDNKSITIAVGKFLDAKETQYVAPSFTGTVIDTNVLGDEYKFAFVTAMPAGTSVPAGAQFVIKSVKDSSSQYIALNGTIYLGAVIVDDTAVLDTVTVMKNASITAETVEVLKNSGVDGIVAAKELKEKSEEYPKLGKLAYDATYEVEGYTVYTVFVNIDPELVSDITLTKDLTLSGEELDLSGYDINITIADGCVLKLETKTVGDVNTGSKLIIGTPATVLGEEGSSITGVVVIDGALSYIVAYADVDLDDAEIYSVYDKNDASKCKDAVYSILDIEDIPYVALFANEATTVKLADADKKIVPEVEGYNFTKWCNYDDDKDSKIGETNAYADFKAVTVFVTVKFVTGIAYYCNGIEFAVYDTPVKVEYNSVFTAKISDTSKYQGTPLVNGKNSLVITDDVEIVGSGVTPIPEPPQPEPEPVVGDSGLSLTDILLIVLVILIAIMVVILVLRLNRS